MKCENCNGTGKILGFTSYYSCEKCNGTGVEAGNLINKLLDILCNELINKIIIDEQVKKDIEVFKNISESDLSRYYFSFGIFLKNKFQLCNEEGEFHKLFKAELGIWYADDMSEIIITSLHRHLNNKPLEIEEQARFYLDYWKKLGY